MTNLNTGAAFPTPPIEDGDWETLRFALDRVKLELGKVPEAWIAPTLLNSWVNHGAGFSNVGYHKDPWGYVHLRGLAASGSSATSVIFTLPAGYRPASERVFASVANDAFCEIRVQTDGDVFAQAGGSTANFTSLDGISFRTV
jgi:hypothetical protein